MNPNDIIRDEKITAAGEKMIEVMAELGLNAIESVLVIGGLHEASKLAAQEFVKQFPEPMASELLELLTK